MKVGHLNPTPYTPKALSPTLSRKARRLERSGPQNYGGILIKKGTLNLDPNLENYPHLPLGPWVEEYRSSSPFFRTYPFWGLLSMISAETSMKRKGLCGEGWIYNGLEFRAVEFLGGFRASCESQKVGTWVYTLATRTCQTRSRSLCSGAREP